VTRSRKLIVLLAVAAVASAGVVTGLGAVLEVGPFEAERDPGPVIATVNGDPIYLDDARSRLEGLASVHGDIEDVFGPDWQQRLLDSLVEDRVIRAEAAGRAIVVTDEELARHVERLRAAFGDDVAFDEWLASQRIDLAELERRILLQTLAAEVYEAVTADVDVDAAQIRAHYREHRDEYVQADGTVAEIWAVKDAIRDDLLKRERDRVFAEWLERAVADAEVVVVMDGWWRQIG
jgi:hypothetical protein